MYFLYLLLGSRRILGRFRSSLGLLSEIDARVIGFVVASHIYRPVFGHVLFDELTGLGAHRIRHFQLVDGVIAVLQFFYKDKMGELSGGREL